MAIDQNILVTVDALIFKILNNEKWEILLIERKNDPYKGKWAFPGGFVEEDEDLHTACSRELEEETGLKIDSKNLKQVGAFGTPGRDPRGRTVTIAFTASITNDNYEIRGGDDAAKARWWPLADLPSLAFDHADILASTRNI
ncbi:MAG: NUDIX hydrolase [Fulvivirga sp.]|nr:NUDIX hydrolase [Fulvivirga sp.]